MNRQTALALLLAFSSGAAGCGVAGGEGPIGPVGESQAALTGADWGVSGNSFSSTGWGANDGTCFLTLMYGQLLGTNGGLYGGTAAGGGTFLSWNSQTNRMEWFVNAAKGDGSGVDVNGTCVPKTAHRVFLDSSQAKNSYVGDNTYSAEMLVPAAPNRQCFITGVYSHDGYTDAGNDNVWIAAPGARATGDPNNWHFVVTTHAMTNQYGQDEGPGGWAEAVCFDVAAVSGGVSWMFPRSTTPWHFTDQNDIACGLTEIAGKFNSGDVAGVKHDNPGFSVQASPTSAMQTTCIQ